MPTRSGAVAKLVFGDLLGSALWFPFWWYTKGLLLIIEKIKGALRYRWQSYAFAIWLKNFFVPMYGQYDITGRLVSVFMRTVVFIGRSIVLVVEAAIYLAGLVLWLIAPALILIAIVINLTARFAAAV